MGRHASVNYAWHACGGVGGGLVARYYVQRIGGDARVHTLLTLGTPHHGTIAAYLLPAPVLYQLRPDSDVMAELAEPSPGCRTRFFAVWSELDSWIVPQRNARLDHPDLLVTNYRLSNVGHLSLPVDPRAVHIMVSALAQLDPSQAPGDRSMATPVEGVSAEAAVNVTNSAHTSIS
jgi:triacylglycerol lipase